MKVLSLFSGIGAFEKALERLGVDVELVGFSEIDKYAVKSYCAIHNVSESMNLGDITKIKEKALPRDIDLITYGFPCQDISVAGKQKGLFNEGGSLTRSGLFFEALRIIEETKPKVAIAENVKNLASKKFNAQFQVVLASLTAAGYNNYYAVLNAKHYGVPQNRERVIIVSIRKDIDNGIFKFPEPVPLEKRLKDVLEEVVDEKYYAIKRCVRINFEREKHLIEISDKSIYQCKCDGGYQDNKVGITLSPTLRSGNNNTFVFTGTRIRRLTPNEWFRLMGFDDESFRKAEAVNSNSQLYKQAGNSIVVDVLEAIFRQMLDENGNFII